MIDYLENEVKIIKLILEVNMPLEHVPNSVSSADSFSWLCKRKFEEDEKQTLHHNHFTGNFK